MACDRKKRKDTKFRKDWVGVQKWLGRVKPVVELSVVSKAGQLNLVEELKLYNEENMIFPTYVKGWDRIYCIALLRAQAKLARWTYGELRQGQPTLNIDYYEKCLTGLEQKTIEMSLMHLAENEYSGTVVSKVLSRQQRKKGQQETIWFWAAWIDDRLDELCDKESIEYFEWNYIGEFVLVVGLRKGLERVFSVEENEKIKFLGFYGEATKEEVEKYGWSPSMAAEVGALQNQKIAV